MSDPSRRVYRYRVDLEGRLWHAGTEITDPATLRFFLSRMEPDAEGGGRVRCAGELNLVEADDTPYVVHRVRLRRGASGLEAVSLMFAGDYREQLDPSTLHVGEANVLYARIRQARFRARFSRPAYHELAREIREQDGRFVLEVAGVPHAVAQERDPR